MSSDFHRVEFGSRSAPVPPSAAATPPAPTPAPQPEAATPPPPPDSVLVPLDQWNRLLGQLGNIHEAGQQLAQARERMARAETENIFLKERIRHLRTEAEEPAEAPRPEPTPLEESPGPGRGTVKVEMPVPRWLSRLRRRAR